MAYRPGTLVLGLSADEQHVMREGHDASRAVDSDPSKASNPYTSGTNEHRLWRYGWNLEWQPWYGRPCEHG